MVKPNPPFMSGVPELLVLRLLSQREMSSLLILVSMNLTLKV